MDHTFIHLPTATREPACMSCFVQGVLGPWVKDRALSGRTTG